ncbi:MAG: MarR family transcriptional regulator [Tannerella sp.]|jgi:DNA-binding MarR family transcriptional regulator|nr:MarR family transcriptional regulator [Tannerella sp.]
MKTKDNTFSVEKAEDSSGFLLWQVTSLWQRAVRQALEQYGLTHSQFVLLTCLHWLSLHHEEITQITLSVHSKIDAATTSAVLRTLQKKGFIRRQEHSTDTRAKKIALTAKGKGLAKKAIVTVEQVDKAFFSSLGSEVAVLNTLLNSLVKKQEA